MALELVLACEAIGAAVLAADVRTREFLGIWIGAMLGGAVPEEIGPPLGAKIAPFDIAMVFLCARSIDSAKVFLLVAVTKRIQTMRAFGELARRRN